MKMKNYEKKTMIFVGIGFLFFLEMIFIFFLWKQKTEEYQKMNGFVSHQNQITIYATEQERKLLYQNQKMIFQNEFILYKIEEDRGFSMKIGEVDYYEMLIQAKLKKKFHDNEGIEFSIQKGKKRLIQLLKTIWEGG